VSAIDLAVARLKVDEGFRASVYVDTRGHMSIGYGFNVDAGISEPAAAALLTAQASESMSILQSLPWYAPLNDVRASVLIELAFNLGITGLLGFTNMIAAIRAGNWRAAHDQLLDSDAAREMPARYRALAGMLLTGEST
jgi:lysozyme